MAALRVWGRLRTLRRLASAVIGLCNPQGSTAHEILEWQSRQPCRASGTYHWHTKCIEMRKARARLVMGLRYGVAKGVLEEHAGRYKLAMAGGGRPQAERPRSRERAGNTCRSSRRLCYTLSSVAQPRHSHRHPVGPAPRCRTCCSRTSRRRQPPRQRRSSSVHLQRSCQAKRYKGPVQRASTSSRAKKNKSKPKPKPKGKAKGKGKGKTKAKAKGKSKGDDKGTSGSGGCVGCGEGRPGGTDQKRASHLMMHT